MVSHQPPPYSEPARSFVPSLAPSAIPGTHRASSVTSGRSATRRHRHARSHHGGSSTHLAQNEFPYFSHTGDVEIVIRNASGRKENRYLLHRLILSQCSGFFEAGTRAEWSGANGAPVADGGLPQIDENESVAGSSSMGTGTGTGTGMGMGTGTERRPSYELGRRRWHYGLDWDAAGDDELPMLVQKEDGPPSIFGGAGTRPPPVRNKPPTSSDSFFRSMSNLANLNLDERSPPSALMEPGDEVLKDYDNLFRTMYQYPPALDTLNIATAYTECKALLHLADMYDALEIVGSRVDHHLLRFGGRLMKQIAKYPPSYLKLGYLARSRTIFTEALIHVVGQWPAAAPQLRGQIDTNVMELLEDKMDELREMEDKVESKLWRLNLTTSRGERVSPSNDFLSWLAMSLFRQWLAENTTPATPGILKDPTNARAASRSSAHLSSHRSTQPPVPPPKEAPAPITMGRVYRTLGSADPSIYLPRDELKRFLKSSQPQLNVDLYTRDTLKRFERRVEDLKNKARDAVQPLMRNHLELDLRDFGPAGLGYLTCVRVDARDLPWEEG